MPPTPQKARPLWTWFAYLGGAIVVVLLVIIASTIYGMRTQFTDISDKYPQIVGRELQWEKAMVLEEVRDIGDCISPVGGPEGKKIGSVPKDTRVRVQGVFEVRKFANPSYVYAKIRILEGPHSGEEYYARNSYVPGLIRDATTIPASQQTTSTRAQ